MCIPGWREDGTPELVLVLADAALWKELDETLRIRASMPSE
jgi:hypothetical protein